MNRPLCIIVLSILILFNSCGINEERNIGSEIDLLDNKHFNSVLIGDSIHVIESKLGLCENSFEERLIYKDTLNDEAINYRELIISIDQGSAYEITIDHYLVHDSLTNSFFLKCKNKLDEVYGTSDKDNGYAAWSAPSIHDKVIEIELFDESIDLNIPLVSINFYEDFDKSFYAE